jgi:cytoskeletal protein CcmA (bactofilin family)
MLENKRRRRRTDRTLAPESPWTLIGPGSIIHGELLMSGNVLVHGRIEGIVFTDGEVRVTPDGSVEGGIHARRIVMEGLCEGRLEATDEVQLEPGSVVRGDIEARILTVQDGARFLGKWLTREGQTGLKVHPYQNPPGHA